jgi:hypothetical protein
MDDVVSATVITCPTCRHGLHPDASGDSLFLHTPTIAASAVAKGKPRCFSCREPFCTCLVH